MSQTNLLHRGKVWGRILEQSDQKVYMDPQGRVKARYLKNADRTIDANGSFVGSGDQGLAELARNVNIN